MSALVMLHGWGMNSSAFDELREALRPRCEATALDLPGYGNAPACDPYTLEALAADVAARAPERCAVLGWSLGALVALEWARRAPAQVERVVLISATPAFVERASWRCAMDPGIFEGFVSGVQSDPDATLRRFVSLQAQGDDAARRVMHCLREAQAAHRTPGERVLEEGLAVLRDTDLRPALQQVSQPVLVMHGERDQLVPLAAARRLREALPRASAAIVRGAAHAPFVSDVETASRLVLEFLDTDDR